MRGVTREPLVAAVRARQAHLRVGDDAVVTGRAHARVVGPNDEIAVQVRVGAGGTLHHGAGNQLAEAGSAVHELISRVQLLHVVTREHRHVVHHLTAVHSALWCADTTIKVSGGEAVNCQCRSHVTSGVEVKLSAYPDGQRQRPSRSENSALAMEQPHVVRSVDARGMPRMDTQPASTGMGGAMPITTPSLDESTVRPVWLTALTCVRRCETH